LIELSDVLMIIYNVLVFMLLLSVYDDIHSTYNYRLKIVGSVRCV